MAWMLSQGCVTIYHSVSHKYEGWVDRFVLSTVALTTARRGNMNNCEYLYYKVREKIISK